jgi:hypothetical protein
MPLEFGDDEGVAFADGGEGLIEARAGAVGAGEPVVKVDALLRDAELAGSVALGGEVLVVGGAAGVADQGLGHGRECTFSPPTIGIFAVRGIYNTAGQGRGCLLVSAPGVRWGFPLRTPAGDAGPSANANGLRPYRA